VLSFLFSFALSQLHVGTAWQGTWSNGKRSSGSLYICVDSENRVAYGSYGGIGVIQGYLKGNTLVGTWYEAGYDRPYGPFSLTISGTSFSGSWSYWESPGVVSNQTNSFSGSQSSSIEPSRAQCLRPVGGLTVEGTYDGAYLCYVKTVLYLNTYQLSASAAFPSFGKVAGYSPDNGHSVFLSDFYYPSDDFDLSDAYRPEGNTNSTFGPCSTCFDDDGDTTENRIPTKRIVIGALVEDNMFCGYFWQGLYNQALNGGNPICFGKTGHGTPDPSVCGADIIYINAEVERFDGGNTSWLVNAIQAAFDALVLPKGKLVDPFIVGTYTGNGNNNNNNNNNKNNTYKNCNLNDDCANDDDGHGFIISNHATTLLVSVLVLVMSIVIML